MRKQEKKIINKRNKITLVVVLATFLIVVYATFAQPLAYNNTVKALKKVTEIFDLNNIFNNNVNNDKSDNSVNAQNTINNEQGVSNAHKNHHSHDIIGNTPEKWNIKYTKAVKTGVYGSAREANPVKFSGLLISFDVILTGPGDAISYDFTITNGGMITAKVDEIIVVPENNDDSVIAYEMSGVKLWDRLLPGESMVMKVKIYFNDKIDENITYYNDTLKIVVNFAQD